MNVLKKKIITSLFGATILLSIVAPVVLNTYADEEIPDQTTEPEIPTESSFPIEEIPDTEETTNEEENSTEHSEELEIPEETAESSSIEEPTIPDESTFPEESEESQQSDESTETSESEETIDSIQESTTDIIPEPVEPSNSNKDTQELNETKIIESSNTTSGDENNTLVVMNKNHVSKTKSVEKQTVAWIANQPEEIDIKPEDTEYTIQWGDTLWAISIKAETTVEDLAKLNDIQNVDLIFAGDILVLK